MQQNRGAVITIPASSFFDSSSNKFGGLPRIDHNLTSSNTLTARFSADHSETNNTQDRIARWHCNT